jgi:protein-S-isoprenylcysteine O-methyltransferase Ste14
VVTFEEWVRRLAGVVGLVVLGMPLFRVWRSRGVVRGRRSGRTSFPTRWLFVLAMTVAYVGVGVLFWKPVPIVLVGHVRLIVTLVGLLLYLSGVTWYLWGFVTLGSMFGVSSSTSVELYEDHRLVTTGPYAIVRHPMYVGVLLTAMGALCLFRTWSMVVYTPSAFGILFRASREDRLLAEEFGAAWQVYAGRVRGWLPRLRKPGSGPKTRSTSRDVQNQESEESC